MPTLPPFGAPLTLYNSLSRSLEVFAPIDPAMVRLYSCGPTVYNFAHIGNLRAYVFTDTLRRVLNWKGWPVNHVINITDVGHLTSDQDEGEDKMEVAAARQQTTIWEIATLYTKAFKDDLSRLNVLPPSLWSTATDHVQDMIAFARRLEERGVTYELPSGLYLDTARVPDYGYLARVDLAGQEEGARVEAVQDKRHGSDFAVWRRSPREGSQQMEWASPWGPGVPGWHLECSVMSMKYLGSQFDIHTGGIDHRQIHHCNEIAQNQAYGDTDRTGANWWMHNNFLIDRSGKMSKSKQDFTTLPSLVDRGFSPLAFRLFCLSGHYRSELEYGLDTLHAALRRLKRLTQALAALQEQAGPPAWLRAFAELGASRGASFGYQRALAEEELTEPARDLLARFDRAVSNDLMVPQALPIVEQVASHATLGADEKLRLVASMDLVLGLGLATADRRALSLRPVGAALRDGEVAALLADRDRARAGKDYAAADAIRRQLAAAGVEIMDGDRSRWEWMPDLSDRG